MKVIKRNGDRVEFDSSKIYKAIQTANDSVEAAYKRISKTKIQAITDVISEEYLQKGRTKSVEYIADQVEQKLMEFDAYEVAKEYITHRHLHKLARNKYDELMELVREKLSASNIKNQNANVDEASFGGRVGEMANAINKRFALDYLLSDVARSNHLNNEIYEHDLDSYAIGNHNCMSIPYDDLLANGFVTRQTDVRPAGSVNTAMQLVAVIAQLQSLQQFGGVAATHLDWTMVPYVRKSFYKHYKDGIKHIERKEIDYSFHSDLSIDENDYKVYSPRAYEYAMEMTERETKQAAEGLFHNLNTLQSRSGNQLN